jgi:hypothetical protein
MVKYNVTAEEDLEMAPCPFCGESHLVVKQAQNNESSYKGCWYVHCHGCMSDGPLGHRCLHSGDAVKLWNRRAGNVDTSVK